MSKQNLFAVAALAMTGAVVAVVAHFGFFASAKAADTPTANLPAVSQPKNEADEKAIRATADEFIKAFNAGDAKTIGAQWSADAVYIDETGQQFHGRDAIEKEYAQLFKAYPGATVTLFIDSIRFLGPDIALEKGIAKVKLPKTDKSTAARYHVVHAKRDGKWVMVVGHDVPYVSEFDEDRLKDLEWLIGKWKPDVKDSPLTVNFEWMAQRNFIKNTYMTNKDGQATLVGGQIIGWNPKLARIVSWHFDPEGGFGNDVWTKEGDKWVIDASGTLHDGSDSAAVNIITPISANSFTWQSSDRTLEGVGLPDVGPVKLVRVDTKK